MSKPFSLRVSLPLFVVVSALVGCKCGSDDAETAAPVLTAKQRILETQVDDAPPLPARTSSTLSVLEPAAQNCEWRWFDPVSNAKRTVAKFEGACRGARVAWSPNGQKAIVWFDPETIHAAMGAGGKAPLDGPATGEPDRLFVFDAKTGKVQKLEFPKVDGSVDEIGIAESGDIFALAQEPLPEGVRETGRTRVDGVEVVWDVESEGLPALAHAYRYTTNNTWVRTETKPTTEGWDYAMGVDALDVAKVLGPRSVLLLSAHGDARRPVEDKKILAKLKPLTPPDDEEGGGRWIQLGTDGNTFYVWEVSGEFAYNTGLVVLPDAQGNLKKAPDSDFDETTLVSLRHQGPYLLVAHNGTGTRPRLYDLRTQALVFRSDTARATVFWPLFGNPAAVDAATKPAGASDVAKAKDAKLPANAGPTPDAPPEQ